MTINQDVIGFIDETSLELNPQKRRFFGKRKVYLTQKKSRVTLFGFMAFNGKNVLMLTNSSKKEDFIHFLDALRKENKKRRIVPVLDNARIHHAKAAQKEAENLNISLVFLPPYSPDLNPIEFCWKDCKRKLAKFIDFKEMISEVPKIARELMEKGRFSYTKKWFRDIL